jgi:hypothetical protein
MNESYEKFPMKSCVPKSLIGIVPIGTKSSKIPPLFLHSKGGLKVQLGKLYMLSLTNTALNDELFFIVNHTLTVVDMDAAYVKPFDMDIVLITPSLTTNLLISAKPHGDYPPATHLMLAAALLNIQHGQGSFRLRQHHHCGRARAARPLAGATNIDSICPLENPPPPPPPPHTHS